MKYLILLINFMLNFILCNEHIKHDNEIPKSISDRMAYFYLYRNGFMENINLVFEISHTKESFQAKYYKEDNSIEYSYTIKYSKLDTITMTKADKSFYLKLTKHIFIDINDIHTIVYIYYALDQPIDGSIYYIISPEYGIIFAKSETWHSFIRLDKISNEAADTINGSKITLILDQLIGRCLFTFSE